MGEIMKWAYSTLPFRRKSLKEAVDAVAKGGFRCVELLADRPHLFPEDFRAGAINELCQCLAQRNLKVVNLNGWHASALGDGSHPYWLAEDWKERELRIRYTLDCLRLAAALGITTVSTNGGGPIPESMNEREAWRLFVANMHRVTPIAKKLGVKLCFRPEPDQLIRTSAQALEFIKEVEEPEALAVDFDPTSVVLQGEDPCQAFQRLRDHIAFVRLTDLAPGDVHRHTQLGEGVFDIPAFVQCLKECGYEGNVIISVPSSERSPDEVVAASREYLTRHGCLEDKPEERRVS